MADNVTTQSATPATLPANTGLAARSVSYSGDAGQLLAPVGLVAFSGSDDAKVATDIPAGPGTEAAALRVTLPTDGTGKVNAAQSGTWTVTGPLTDTQLRATAVPVSLSGVGHVIIDTGSTTAVTGTVTVAQGTGTNLHAVLDSGSVTETNFPTTVDTNSGVKSASTIRVVLATDQPALTNKLLVTPDSVALPANQSVNISQFSGTTADTNSGVKSAGTLRVVLATDQPALTNKLLVTPDSVALPANQSINNSQINGVTPLMGNGVTGTGSQRVTIASDNTAFSVNATLAAGSALAGKVGIDQTTLGTTNAVTVVPSTIGGWSPSIKAALSNTNSQVKNGAGTLGGYYIYNPNALVTYVQIYDTATGSITVGTTTPKLSYGIPPLSAANIEFTNGVNFATAICVAATTTATGATAPSTAVDCNFYFK